MLVEIPHGEYSEEVLKLVCWLNVPRIQFQNGTMYHS